MAGELLAVVPRARRVQALCAPRRRGVLKLI
jgi:hypothetical protein